MAELSLVQAVRQALDEEMQRDESVFLLGEDVGRRGGVFNASRGLVEKYGEQRVIDAPLAEQALVGIAVGAAMAGMRPVVEIQFADYIYAALGQIVNEAARVHYRSNGAWRVPLVIRAPYGGVDGGGLYHSQSPEAFFTQVPGLKVVVPSNPQDARGLLKAAIRDENPVVFFEPKALYGLEQDVAQDGGLTPIGPAHVARPGTDATVLAYGAMLVQALEAADVLAGEGIEIEVVDVRTLYPLQREPLLASVRKTGRVLIVHEASLSGGFGAEVAAGIAADAFSWLKAPVRRLCAPDVPAVPYSPPMQQWFMPDAEKICAGLRSLLDD